MFDNLSDRAKKMLTRHKRKYIPKSTKQIKKALIAENIDPAQAFIDFETNFGGYQFTASGRWTLRMYPFDDYTDVDHQFLEFAKHDTAQFGFDMDENGNLYVTGTGDYIPLASSITVFLEQEAFFHHFHYDDDDWFVLRFRPVIDVANIPHLKPIPAASDQYGAWWGDDDNKLYLQKWKMWDQDTKWEMRAFCQHKQDIQPIIDYLKRLDKYHYKYNEWKSTYRDG